MDTEALFTVYFDDPFWVGVYERISHGHIEVSRVVFGPEPKDYEVMAFLMRHWGGLKFGPCLKGVRPGKKMANPKRLQRKLKAETAQTGISTKAQQAIQLQKEQSHTEKIKNRKERKEEEKKLQFENKQKKKKQKHKGR